MDSLAITMHVLRRLGSHQAKKEPDSGSERQPAEGDNSVGSHKSPGSSRGRLDALDASEQLPSAPKAPRKGNQNRIGNRLDRLLRGASQGASAVRNESPSTVPGLLRMLTSHWNTQELLIEPVHFQMAREMVGDPLLALGGTRDTSESESILDKLQILEHEPPKPPPELFERGTTRYYMRLWALRMKARNSYTFTFSVIIVTDSVAMALKMDDVIPPTASLVIEAVLNLFFAFDVFVNTMGIDDLNFSSVAGWVFDTTVVVVASADVWILRLLDYALIISDVPQLGNVRVLRLFRLVKAFRLLEAMLKGAGSSAARKMMFRPLRMIIALMMKLQPFLFFIMCTIVTSLGICAVMTRVAFDDDFDDDFDPASAEDNYFPSVPASFFTLVNVASGNLLWSPDMLENMKARNTFGLFVLYSCQYFIVVYVLGLIKAVSFEALVRQGHDFDHQEEMVEKRRKFDIIKIKAALERIDMNHNGHINTDELEYCLHADPSLENTLRMTTQALLQLHARLDVEGTGRVSIGLFLLSMLSEIVGTRSIQMFIQEERVRKVQSVVVDSMNSTTQLCRRLYESLFLQCELMDTIEEIESSYHELINPVNEELEVVERSVEALAASISSQPAPQGALDRMTADVKSVETLKFVGGMLQLSECMDEWRTADNSLAVDVQAWDPVQGMNGHLKQAMDEWKRSDAYKAIQVETSSESEPEHL